MAALITIMLLGHWQEMKALGQARSALAALAELLPDEAERFTENGAIETVPVDALLLGDVVLVRPLRSRSPQACCHGPASRCLLQSGQCS